MWSLTSDHAHCILKIVIVSTCGTYNYNRSLRAPRRAAHSKLERAVTIVMSPRGLIWSHAQLDYF
jgi:hypothetical protein